MLTSAIASWAGTQRAILRRSANREVGLAAAEDDQQDADDDKQGHGEGQQFGYWSSVEK